MDVANTPYRKINADWFVNTFLMVVKETISPEFSFQIMTKKLSPWQPSKTIHGLNWNEYLPAVMAMDPRVSTPWSSDELNSMRIESLILWYRRKKTKTINQW